MKNKFLGVLLTIACVFAIVIPTYDKADAASVSASLSGATSVTQGQTFTVTLTYTGATFGAATAQFTYDTSVLQYVSSSDGPSTASGVFNQNFDSDKGTTALSCTATFKAIGTGTTTISASTVDVYDSNFTSLSANSASIKVSVKAPETASVSSNANLSSLKVSGGSLSPSFSASTTSYTVNVGNSVTVCTVSASPQDSNAKISVSGSKDLAVGKNVRTVTVTAQNGSTKTYTITIIRAEADSSSNTEDEQDTVDSETSNEPQDIIVTVGDQEYIVQEKYDESDIPSGFWLTVAQYGDNEIPVIKDENLKYTFALLKNQATGDDEWFFYNEEAGEFSNTSQLSAEEAMEYASLLASASDNDDEQGMSKTDKIMLIAFGSTLAVLFAVVIVLQIRIVRGRRNHSDDDVLCGKSEDEDE